MNLNFFYVIATSIYTVAIGKLAWEYYHCPKRERWALQTFPLMLSYTAFYLAVVIKVTTLVRILWGEGGLF